MNTALQILRALAAAATVGAYGLHQVATARKSKRTARKAELVILASLSFQVGATLGMLMGDHP